MRKSSSKQTNTNILAINDRRNISAIRRLNLNPRRSSCRSFRIRIWFCSDWRLRNLNYALLCSCDLCSYKTKRGTTRTLKVGHNYSGAPINWQLVNFEFHRWHTGTCLQTHYGGVHNPNMHRGNSTDHHQLTRNLHNKPHGSARNADE